MKDIDVMIITGMSGAGKTVALHALEDMDYFVVDNVPSSIGSKLIETLSNEELHKKKLALGLDIRSYEDTSEFEVIIKKLKEEKLRYKVIFLDARDSEILNRYTLSRRKHPLEEKTLIKSVQSERIKLNGIRQYASLVIDTSGKRSVVLRREIEKLVSEKDRKEISIHLRSFGFKYGVPRDLDLMFDVRCLPNPYYLEKLKPKTGNDQEVVDYVMESEVSKEYYKKLVDMLEFLIPNYILEGKNHLSIGIGCSGGKHRSVTFVNLLNKRLQREVKLNVFKSHREEERGNWG